MSKFIKDNHVPGCRGLGEIWRGGGQEGTGDITGPEDGR